MATLLFVGELALRVVIMLGFILFVTLVLIWVERKFIGHIQMRLGPMRTGFHGLLQSPADAIKLLVKEDLRPQTADRWTFELAPYVVFVSIFLVFVSLPITQDIVVRSLDLGLFYIVAVTTVSIVGFVIAGWGSDNKYALLGAMRAAAQLVSYEVPMILAVLSVALLAKSLDFVAIVESQSTIPYIVFQPLGFLLFLIAGLAELNRTPFDIPLAESEVVGGPFIEYSGMRWGLFFLAEYANVFAIAAIATLIYLGGWRWPFLPPEDWLSGWAQRFLGISWFMVKTSAIILLIFWLRATLPRLRVDQLMIFAWKIVIPIAFVNLLLTGFYMMYGTTALIASAPIVLGAIVTIFRLRQRRLVPWWASSRA